MEELDDPFSGDFEFAPRRLPDRALLQRRPRAPAEEIIYLASEDDLTAVRERMERATTRNIVLVVPPQTQLLSHVGWRLLRARAQELGKDVVVISSDRQIRSVAKAAGLKVADSLEFAPRSTSRRPRKNPS